MISELDRNLIALHVIADALTQMADAMQRDNDADGGELNPLTRDPFGVVEEQDNDDADDDTPPDGPKVRDSE